ncbi:MAG: hypothetical protein R3A10_22620 [Caldilineaceae bacterium]
MSGWWTAGSRYDALLPAIFRLQCLAMDFLWATRHPALPAGWRNWRPAFQQPCRLRPPERSISSVQPATAAARQNGLL